MSDPPPRPKPGSLRDRIAAFEKGGDSKGPAPAPPAPRPKPGGLQWKPKPPSPPDSPSVSSTEGSSKTGMNASDAKASIGIGGGSLKERMAALQKGGAFGAPAPPTAPKPAVEKPKWKPPPKVVPVDKDDDDDDNQRRPSLEAIVGGGGARQSSDLSVKKVEKVNEDDEEKKEGDDVAPADDGDEKAADDEGEPDPEEEERQRRAALAARMAKLGGTRVGMAPMFGGGGGARPPPPVAKKPQRQSTQEEPVKEKSSEETEPAKAEDSTEASSPPPIDQTQPKRQGSVHSQTSADPAPAPKSSLDSTTPSSDTSQSRSPPTSMPMPAVARRAGPPRKKPTPKSPEIESGPATTPPALVTSPESARSTDPIETPGLEKDVKHALGREEEIEVPKKEREEEEEAADVGEAGATPAKAAPLPEGPIASKETSGYVSDKEDDENEKAVPGSRKASLDVRPEPEKEDISAPIHDDEDDDDEDQEKPLSPLPVAAKDFVSEPLQSDPLQEEAPQAEEQDQELDPEAEEAARRKRIAEKLGKMGGVNPFALPPPAGATATSPPPPPTSSPPPAPPVRRASQASRSGSIGEVVGASSPPLLPVGTKPGSRKSSLDVPTPASPPPIVAATKPGHGSRKGSIREQAEEEEGKQVEEENTSAPQEDDNDGVISEDEGINDQSRPHDIGNGTFDQDHPERTAVSHEHEQEDLTPGEDPTPVITTPIQETSASSLSVAPAPPPLPNKASRPQEATPQSQSQETYSDSPPPPPARNLPPPPPPPAHPRLVRHPVEEGDDDDEGGNDSDLTRSMYSDRGALSPAQSQPPLSSRAPSEFDDDEADGQPRQLPPRRQGSSAYDEDADEDDSEPAIPVPHRESPTKGLRTGTGTGTVSPPAPAAATYGYKRPPFRAIPMSPASSQGGVSDVESMSDGEALQIPPRRRPDTPDSPLAGGGGNNAIPIVVPPRIEAVEPSPLRQSHGLVGREEQERDEQGEEDEDGEREGERERGRHEFERAKKSLDHLSPPPRGGEILDDDEGDPIDPGFHSPPSRRASTIGLSASAASPPPPQTPPAQETVPAAAAEPEAPHDEEKARRQTIADRMARLGGIKFGAAPPIAPRRAAPQAPQEEEGSATTTTGAAAPEPAELDEEEEERARKERIAAKLAGMGGMRIGMMPMGFGRPQVPASSAAEPAPPAPPPRAPPARPPPPPQAPEPESDFETEDLAASQPSLSDDGVQVEALESEIEEGYEDVNEPEQEQEEEEVPPPVPDRGARRRGTGSDSTEVPPPLPPGRPPVPGTRKSSIPTTITPGRKSSVETTHEVQTKPPFKSQQSEYVMVEEPADYSDDVPPPLPPGRHTQTRPPAPTRGVPPPAPGQRGSTEQQWDLTSSIEFSDTPDLALSWTDASHPGGSGAPPPPPAREMPPPPPQDTQPNPPPISERHYSPDDLIAVWGRVGVQVCEVATSLYEKSKKALIGDGTYEGFVHTVLSEVPNALQPSLPRPFEYGYVVYVQSAHTVQKRVSDIMPGDVVEIHDAKLKGHKGLQGYTQNIEQLVGIVSEYEPKKSKIRVFQANQHVGHQTVEAVSYRLDDLKSGSIKIYRVLEN